MKKQNTQNGNALWFILIAILLLGLLTSMMTRSGSSTNDTGDYEQLSIQANEILNYAKSIENGVQSLLARGCSENEISFEANNNSGYTNPNSPADNSCHVFEPEGSGLTYIKPNEKWLDNNSSNITYGDYYFAEGIRVQDVQTNSGNSSIDLLMILPLINQNICSQINNLYNVNVIPVDLGIINATQYDAEKFTGGYEIARGLGDNGGLTNNAVIAGKTSLCIQVDSNNPLSDSYHFYHTLIAR